MSAAEPGPRQVALTLNGVEHRGEAPPRMTLADYLRDRCGLTGTHLGCEQGICGACTVDGCSTRACTTLAAQASGGEVWTVEGLSPSAGLSRLQQSLADHHGLQCGFCTPGIVVAATELLARYGRDLDEAQVREELGGSLCRCTGYDAVVDAVLAVARDATGELLGTDHITLADPPELTTLPTFAAAPTPAPPPATGTTLPLVDALRFAAGAAVGYLAVRLIRRP
jgi:aerobic carbon-monoxide dehydrogenase small subunit